MSITLQYCSDLHLEFELNKKWLNKYPIEVAGDVLLLAGDIVPFARIEQHNDFFDFLSRSFKTTYWVPGNHEYYGSDIIFRSGPMHEAIRDNVFLVNNTTVQIEDVTLICATLWSQINPANEWAVTRAMSDFHVIRNGGGRFDVAEYNRLHSMGRNFIEEALKDNKQAQKIVMTHHVPTFKHYPEKYRGDVLNQAFATELYDLINDTDIACWIYGHHHTNTPDFKIGSTEMLTNQLGYVKHGEHIDFRNPKTFEIG